MARFLFKLEKCAFGVIYNIMLMFKCYYYPMILSEKIELVGIKKLERGGND